MSPHDPKGHGVFRGLVHAPPDGARVREHLIEWITVDRGHIDRVEAHYDFDELYVRAHPESVDDAHLSLLQGLLTAKLFDDGELIVTAGQLSGALSWPSVDAPGRSFTRRMRA